MRAFKNFEKLLKTCPPLCRPKDTIFKTFRFLCQKKYIHEVKKNDKVAPKVFLMFCAITGLFLAKTLQIM